MDFEKREVMPIAEAPSMSRAVRREIASGTSVICTGCDTLVKFNAHAKAIQVICNVYVNGVWKDTKHYHEECYETVGEPYGPPLANESIRPVTVHALIGRLAKEQKAAQGEASDDMMG